MTTTWQAIDIGNTAIKAGRFDRLRTPPRGTLPTPTSTCEWPTPQLEIPLPLSDLPGSPVNWLISSVNRPAHERFVDWLSRQRPHDEVTTLSFRDVPLAIGVDAPERVGMDRLATAVAADHLRAANRPAIVIDAGTALKIHVVTERSEFPGGAILPGFQMASRALSGNTDLLPLVPVSTNIESPPVLGKNTTEAIRSGIYWGAVGAAREIVERIRAALRTNPQIFITGGDAGGLASLINHDTQFVPHLCLAGIALMAAQRSSL